MNTGSDRCVAYKIMLSEKACGCVSKDHIESPFPAPQSHY